MTKALQKSLQAVGKTLQSTGKQVAAVGAGISAAGAAILAPLTAAVAHFVEVGDNLGDMAARTGVAASALAELGYAATLSGTDLDTVEKSLIKMQKTLGDAAGGSKSASAAFEDLGLSIDALLEMSPDEKFQAIADALAGLDSSDERMSKAMKVFGKGAAAILPMLENLRKLREEAQKEGLIPSEEAVAAASAIDDSFNKLKATVSSLAFEVGAALADEVLAFAEFAREAIKTVRDWVKENQVLIKIAAGVGVALVAVGAAVTAVGGALIAAGLVASGFAAVIGGITTAIAFLATPLGIVVASVAAVVAALTAGVVWWAKFTDSGRAAVKVIRDVFGGIFDALKAGKWQLAGDIAMAALKLAWVKGTNALEAIWDSLMDKISEAFYAVINELKDAWNAVFGDVMPIGGGDAEPGARDTSRADARAKREADARKALADLIASAGVVDGKVVVGGGGVGAGGMDGNKPSGVDTWFRGNVKNVITNSGAAAAAAGYMGGVRNAADPYTKAIMKIEKKLDEMMHKNDKHWRSVDRIAEGLHHG